ncbi:aldehyde dehydrogenase family protein [Brevibacterium sp. VCM10]|uniref:aldehyde dehydrogenase family protein n=1 Tax=Brevibacterium sp. VCM10 TaxID=1381751 RepID=UPI0018CC05C6|nr:aldehyde dehydrogenase family protein [Brevibacterium sp. VCM10]
MTDESVDKEVAAITRNGVPHYRMYIDGAWVDTSDHYEVVNPATGEICETSARATTDHVDAAVAAAGRAFAEGSWRKTDPVERAAIFDRAAAALSARTDEIATTVARETGMAIRTAGALGVGFPMMHLQYFADLTRRFDWTRSAPIAGPVLHSGYIRKEPLGVCAGITPWNFPASTAVWKSIPAMAAGNSVVLKVDEKTPSFALELAGLLHDAGLPAGVFNVIVGDGPVIGEHLVRHDDVSLISFTGSTVTGRRVMANASESIKRVLLELGGKSANVVLDDADIDLAVDGAIYAFALHAGQACESGSRLLLPASKHDEFVARLIARLQTMKIGDPLDPATDMGAVMSPAQLKRIRDYIELGKEEGATLAYGGGTPSGPEFAQGYWVEPTVFTGVSNGMRIAQEEIFGPVLSVITYDSVDEAVEIANDSAYGLAAGVWSTDNARAIAVAERLEAGSVWINDWHNMSQYLPFGGYKQSGIGRELGPDSLEEFTQDKSITVDLSGDLSKRAYGIVLGTPPS